MKKFTQTYPSSQVNQLRSMITTVLGIWLVNRLLGIWLVNLLHYVCISTCLGLSLFFFFLAQLLFLSKHFRKLWYTILLSNSVIGF